MSSAKNKLMQNFAETFFDSDCKEVRSNTWTFCMYPGDSQPDDWFNIISRWHLPALVSPVHDADLNGDGMEKKKHQHVILYFGKGANKSFEQVSKFVHQVGGCQPVTVSNGPGLSL